MVWNGRALGRAVGALGWIVAAGWFTWWQAAHRADVLYNTAIYPISDADEWRYTACSRLVAHGDALFRQVYSAQPPLLFAALASSMRLFGDSIAGARVVEILFGVLGLTAIAWLTWVLAGPVAAAAASLLLAVSPAFLVYSHAVEAEGPMAALVALAMALAASYRALATREVHEGATDEGTNLLIREHPGRKPERGRRGARPAWVEAGSSAGTQRWARVGLPSLPMFAGLVMALAILTKLFAIEALVPGIFLVALPVERRARAVTLFLAAALLPVVAEMVLVAPQQQFQQVISLHTRAGALLPPGTSPSWLILWHLFQLDAGLSLLALAGVAVLAALGVWEDLGFLVLWLGGQAVMLLLFRPLFPHHPAILLPAMAVPAGIAVTVGVEQLRSHRWLAAVPLAALFVLYLVLLPHLAHDDRHVVMPGAPARGVALAAFVDAHVPAAGVLATDELMVADLAHRSVPPGICDPSNVRLYAGELPASELISQTREYHAVMVLPSFGIFWQVRGYKRWVIRHFQPVTAPYGVTAYVDRAAR
ncbi:MAG TPA: glycosyltransferase family 39 protein [Chloroflexota bacterium]|nr:glycosyltransferase family 39 protein [Chloroflexota bacterium]